MIARVMPCRALAYVTGVTDRLQSVVLPLRPLGRRSPAAVGLPAAPEPFGYRPGALERARARLQAGDAALGAALTRWVAEADAALRMEPASVVDKPDPAASGDPHDYLSYAPYYWPNPAGKNGLPYLRRDGEFNPESYDGRADKSRLLRMQTTVETLGLAYALTANEAYAEDAARHLRAWFVTPATRMNPHLDYAQVIPGKRRGRRFGVLDGHYLLPALDAAVLLAGSPHWRAADRRALSIWAEAFLDWLLISSNARQEAVTRNNHGTLYDVQKIHFALLVGDAGLAARTAEAAKSLRIARPIAAEGAQPYELRRTQALHYSQYNLVALFKLATRAEHAGVDLWSYCSRQGGSIRRALDFLMPYLEAGGPPWPYSGERWAPGFASVLVQAGCVYGEARYPQALERAPAPIGPRLPDLIC